MDLVLAQHARELGKRVVTLETVAFQRSLLAELMSAGGHGPDEISAMLVEDSDEIIELVDAYRSGSVDEITKLSRPDDARMQEILLDARNRRWVQALGPALAKGGVFAAVGVGHAPGPMGLVELFSQRGYRLQQYPAASIDYATPGAS